ncbi:MAG: LysR substrate-binding domain-containing protein [Neomegalonema sp.]|nr:LysR substrate-binding domain-containing protein [Neomegalonema sp.]
MLDSSNLADLWFFRAAATHESFSKAAAELHITQGAVSQRIRNLEARLGVVLFERVGRRVLLTNAGRRLLRVSGEAFETIDQELRSILREQQSGRLTLSCIPSFAMDWLIPRLDDWYRDPSRPRIRIIAELNLITRESMINDGVDIAIRFDPYDYPDLVVQNLLEETLCPVCAPTHPLPANEGDFERFLRDANLIHDAQAWEGAPPSTEWETWLRVAGFGHISHDRGDFFNLNHVATRAAVHGQGVAIGRSLLVRDHLKKGELVQPIDSSIKSRGMYRLITLLSPTANSDISLFIHWLTQKLDDE